MFSVDLSTAQRDSDVVAASCGDLDVADAAPLACASGVAAAREPEIAVGLAGLPSRGPACHSVWAGHSRSRPGRCAAASRARPQDFVCALLPGRAARLTEDGGQS